MSIDLDRLVELEPGPPPALDAERHYLEGAPEDVADYMLVLDSINFGSGWFPTLRKRPGMSGYFTVAVGADRPLARGPGPWSAAELRALKGADVAAVLGQEPDHELMGLYAEALRDLGRFLDDRRALDLVAEAGGSAERLASMLAAGMPFFDDRGFWKRAQITAERPRARRRGRVLTTSTASRSSPTTWSRTCCGWTACSGTTPRSAARIDAGELLPPGEEEREIRGCAVHACELLSERLGMPARLLDTALWNRGQAPRYKSVPRHRTRTVYY